MSEATRGNEALQRFLRQVAGYCLTGATREHALFFVHGPGGNGKSVFLGALQGILGDYATVAAMDTFTATHGTQHPTDLAGLAGARVVAASETEEGRAWAESRIKAITGGDKISARFMRRDFFSYTPQFKLVIVGNHAPTLRNVDEAARRRFNIIPFTNKPSAPDQKLDEKIKPEWPAILRWAIDGCLDWQANELTRPDVVRAVTDSYMAEQNLVSRWIEDECVRDQNVSDTAGNLFAAWSRYAAANGEKPGTTRWFSHVLRREGCDPVRDAQGIRGRGFAGIAIRPPSDADKMADSLGFPLTR